MALTTLVTVGIFHTAHATYPGENGVIVFDSGTIKRVSPGNSTVTDLTPGFGGRSPRVSPNGKKIAFRSADTQSIYVMNIDGSNRVQLTDFPVMSAAWLPDGSKLAYTYPVGSWVQLWTMNPDGTGKTFVRNLASSVFGTPGYGLAWSPSGNIYTFGERELYITDDVNPSIRTLSNVGSKSSWAPDGASILFRDDTSFGLYEINPDGSNLRAIGSAGAIGVSAISPDGKLVAGGIFPNNQPQLATRIRADSTITTFSWPITASDTDWSRMPMNCDARTPQGGGGVLAGDVDFYAAQCAIAVMPDGGLNGVLQQAIAVGPDQRLYHRALKTSPSGGTPTWTRFLRVPGVASNPNGVNPKKIAIAASKDGSVQVVIINAADNAVYHALRDVSGNWSGFSALDGWGGAPNFQAHDVAITINASSPTSPGNAQVIANGLVLGSVFHRVRWPAGNWTPFVEVPGAAGTSTRELAIAADEDGNTNVLATISTAHGIQNQIIQALRDVDGNWTSWVTVNIPGTTLSSSTDVAVTRTLSGTAQLMFTDAAGNAFFQERSNPNLPSSWQSEVISTPIASATGRAVSISAGATANSSSQLLLTRTFPQ